MARGTYDRRHDVADCADEPPYYWDAATQTVWVEVTVESQTVSVTVCVASQIVSVAVLVASQIVSVTVWVASQIVFVSVCQRAHCGAAGVHAIEAVPSSPRQTSLKTIPRDWVNSAVLDPRADGVIAE